MEQISDILDIEYICRLYFPTDNDNSVGCIDGLHSTKCLLKNGNIIYMRLSGSEIRQILTINNKEIPTHFLLK